MQKICVRWVLSLWQSLALYLCLGTPWYLFVLTANAALGRGDDFRSPPRPNFIRHLSMPSLPLRHFVLACMMILDGKRLSISDITTCVFVAPTIFVLYHASTDMLRRMTSDNLRPNSVRTTYLLCRMRTTQIKPHCSCDSGYVVGHFAEESGITRLLVTYTQFF